MLELELVLGIVVVLYGKSSRLRRPDSLWKTLAKITIKIER